MLWFCTHIRSAASLALFALLLQVAVSFSHRHEAQTGHSAPLTGLPMFGPTLAGEAPSAPTPDHDSDNPARDCAICATVNLLASAQFNAPPLLSPPQTFRAVRSLVASEPAPAEPPRFAFRSRAPPFA